MKFVFPLDAVPQGRPRFIHGHAIDPPKSRKFKADITLMVLNQRQNKLPLYSELSVVIRIYRNFKKRIVPKYGDVDNLVKGILDGITQSGVVWKDDSQIVELHSFKFLDKNPRIEIEVEEIHNEQD